MDLTTAPATLIETGEILHALLRDSWRIDQFHAIQLGGNTWALVSRLADGHWVLTEDSTLSWYPGETFTEDGSEPELEAQIDATTPRHLAEAAHNIITAPADQRAYVAAVEGPNVPPTS
jgi:hypothetical protein